MTRAAEDRPLRVAVLNRRFATLAGGAESYSVRLVEMLAATHEIHVFAQEIEHRHPGVTYHRIAKPLNRMRWLNQLWYSFETWRRTRKGFDVVHSHEHVWHGQIQTLHVTLLKYNLVTGRQGWARIKGYMKLVTSVRLLAYWWLERSRVQPAPGRVVVAVSRNLKDELLCCFPLALGYTQVIPPGVNCPFPTFGAVMRARKDACLQGDLRRQWVMPEEAVVLLFVANDYQRKGLDVLLQAMATLDARMHLLVVGQARDRSRYEASADRMGLTQRVRFAGAQSDLTPFYLGSDILVHPTLGDTWGMVVPEAMSLGLPVVVSGKRWCGVASHLSDELAHVLSDPLDVAALAGAINAVLNNESCRNMMVEQAFQFAQQSGWDQVAAAHAHLYRTIALS